MYIINEPMDMVECARLFDGALTLGPYEPVGAVLKRKTTELSAFYGLFTNDQMIAYLWLMKWDGHIYRVHETTVADQYQRKGLATYLYKYPVLNDGITLLSDRSHTTASMHLWRRLQADPAIRMAMYNAITKVSLAIDNDALYGNDHLHLVAFK